MNGVTDWSVIVPIKPWRLSKSRLGVDDATRIDLSRAFALDVLDAVSGSTLVDQIVIVTAELELTSVARSVGAVIVADRPMLPGERHNRAVNAGRHWCEARRPDAPVVVVPADLPALTTQTFDAALGMLEAYERAFVPDSAGVGTTLLSAHRPALLKSAYGEQSARRHSCDGSRAVAEVDPRVRRDVDTALDLVEAMRLGVGVHTAAAQASPSLAFTRTATGMP